ncbi:MAG TPA: dipeptidase [Candidatus Dormibacteraeota bacterium]|jgi:acetylornithine deacetylase/succinyl-diaminopimelate desuccinylase-like protein
MSTSFEHASANLSTSMEELFELLRIPSISALPQHAGDIRVAAEASAEALRRAGMESVHLAEPDTGNPVVRGDWLGAGPGAPTLLLYGHYDVQPADPLDEWSSPPFEPEVRNGKIYARGSSDNKGQFFAILKGLEAVMAAQGKLPVNVKWTIEGEEEISGRSLFKYLADHKDELKADAVFVADNNFPKAGVPAVLTGLRGLVYTELEVQGASADLHSGTYGGGAPNPLNALGWIIAGLKDSSGHVTIPGFYDRVLDPSPEEVESWQRLGIDEDALLRDEIGSDAFFGEAEYGVLHRLYARPTLDVHGVLGGFVGDGPKTVIPAKAMAKISMRLVPNQDPREIFELYQRRVAELTTPGIKVKIKEISLDEPVSAPVDGRGVQAAARAFRRAFETEPVFVRMGGSIPVMAAFQQHLGVELIASGFGLPDDRLHSPNEKLDVSQFEGGIKTSAALLEEFAG